MSSCKHCTATPRVAIPIKNGIKTHNIPWMIKDNLMGIRYILHIYVNLFSSKQNITWHLISLKDPDAVRKCLIFLFKARRHFRCLLIHFIRIFFNETTSNTQPFHFHQHLSAFCQAVTGCTADLFPEELPVLQFHNHCYCWMPQQKQGICGRNHKHFSCL